MNLYIIKGNRDKNFSIIDLTIFNDKRLSWKARGLHVYLVSRPPNWNINREILTTLATDGKDSVSSGLQELIDLQYLYKVLIREGGMFKGIAYIVFDRSTNIDKEQLVQYVQLLRPKADKPPPDDLLPEEPAAVNPTHNKYIYNNNIYSKNIREKAATNVAACEASGTDIDSIISFWNCTFKDVDNIKSDSNCPVIIRTVLEKGYKPSEIKEAIFNYYKVFTSDEYFYHHKWSLYKFIDSGLQSSTGFINFLNKNNPLVRFLKSKTKDIYTELRNKFSPVCFTYDRSNILDKNKNTYLGVDTDRLKDEAGINRRLTSLEVAYYNNTLLYGHLEWLEEVIASYLFKKKDPVKIVLLIEMHEEIKRRLNK